MTTTARSGVPTAAPALEQRVDVETPELVTFSYTVAGIGSRAAAAVIDTLIMIVLITGIWMLIGAVAGAIGPVVSAAERMSGAWAIAIALLVAFAIQWGYYVLFEAIWDGQTPGKRLLKIRVVQDGGYSVSFAASAARNIVRIVDMQPVITYAVGIVSAALSRSGKRLGDLVAGTFVVHERVTAGAPVAASGEELRATPVSAALSVAEYELLDRFLARRASLDPDRRTAMAAQLADRFAAHLPPADGTPALARLLQLHASETAARARGAAARGATGAAREQHALVARNAARWSAFASRLADAQRRGLRAMSEREVSELVAQYRELTTDLARLQTAARGRDVDALFYVSRLVGAGHNLLYRQRGVSIRGAMQFLLVSVPRELRRSAVPILAAAGLLFAPMAITYRAVVRTPSLAKTLLPAAMIDRATEGAAHAKRGDRTYVRIRDFERPVMASRIISNNVQVTYTVFAAGITAGIGTVLTLVFNGVSIGAVMGLYATKGVFNQLGEFVLPHSVFELSAICIAGGGGLLIAAALLLPGARTRREALVINGRRAIRLITASTILLLFAGTIEGLISPRTDIPVAVKIGIAIACAVALAAYVSLGGRGGAGSDEPAEEFAYSEARALISR